jgi:hypothetical protein
VSQAFTHKLPLGCSIREITMRPATLDDDRLDVLVMLLRTIERVDGRVVYYPLDLWANWDEKTWMMVMRLYEWLNRFSTFDILNRRRGRR